MQSYFLTEDLICFHTDGSRTNFIAFDSKIAIYKITNSKLIPYNKSNDEAIISTLKNIKANTIASALLEKLKTRYNIKSYMKSN